MRKEIDLRPLKYFLSKNKVILNIENTTWSFFSKENCPAIGKYKGRVLFNLEEYSHYLVEIESNVIYLWWNRREEVLYFRNGRILLEKYYSFFQQSELLYKAEVFPAPLERELSEFTELSIPVDWRQWCPQGNWPKWAVEAARKDVLEFIQENKLSRNIVEYAIHNKLIGWVPENTLLRSIKRSNFDWDTLKRDKKDLFDYFVQTIINCDYQKLIATMLA